MPVPPFRFQINLGRHRNPEEHLTLLHTLSPYQPVATVEKRPATDDRPPMCKLCVCFFLLLLSLPIGVAVYVATHPRSLPPGDARMATLAKRARTRSSSRAPSSPQPKTTPPWAPPPTPPPSEPPEPPPSPQPRWPPPSSEPPRSPPFPHSPPPPSPRPLEVFLIQGYAPPPYPPLPHPPSSPPSPGRPSPPSPPMFGLEHSDAPPPSAPPPPSPPFPVDGHEQDGGQAQALAVLP